MAKHSQALFNLGPLGGYNRQKATRQLAPKGYTLIEIMVVVVIIGILAALIVPNILSRPDQARAVATKTDIRAISSALELYRLDNFNYPSQEEGLSALVTPPSGADNWREGGYMTQLPKDPWKRSYIYVVPGVHNPQSYDLYSLGKDGVEGSTSSNTEIGNWE